MDYQEDPNIDHPQGVVVRLDGIRDDLAIYVGQWGNACAEQVNSGNVVLSYSGWSVKESGNFGSGTWHVKGGTMRYSHKEYPGRRALSSGRVELMNTIRCLTSIRLEGGWA